MHLVNIEDFIASMSMAQQEPLPTHVSQEDVENMIDQEYTFCMDDALDGMGLPPFPGMEKVTVHMIVLRNGYKAMGVNYGAIEDGIHSPEYGAEAARDQALDKVYEVLGYHLRESIYQSKDTNGRYY